MSAFFGEAVAQTDERRGAASSRRPEGTRSRVFRGLVRLPSGFGGDAPHEFLVFTPSRGRTTSDRQPRRDARKHMATRVCARMVASLSYGRGHAAFRSAREPAAKSLRHYLRRNATVHIFGFGAACRDVS